MFWKTEGKGKQAESERDQSHPGKPSRRMLNLRCSASRLAVCLAVSVLFSLDLCKGVSPGSEDGQGHFSREEGQVDVEVDGQGWFVAGASEKGRRTMIDIVTFLEATNYTTRSPRPALPVQSDDGNSGKSCTVEITSPRLGHNGDAAAAPRIARTRAWVEARVRGEACVQKDGFTLMEDIQILVLVSSSLGHLCFSLGPKERHEDASLVPRGQHQGVDLGWVGGSGNARPGELRVPLP
jgi:hypothetical protein